MNLSQLQRSFLDLIMQPMTPLDGLRTRTSDGRSVEALATAMIRPSDRATSFERLELYNTGYWFRILETLAEDFPGLRAVIGPRNFDRLSAAYLTDCPPISFDLGQLGAKLEAWLRKHPTYAQKRERLALDMVRLEWAEIEVADAPLTPRLVADDLSKLGQNPRFYLQPGLRLVELVYPVDDLLIAMRGKAKEHSDIASNAVSKRHSNGADKRCWVPKRQKVNLVVHRHGDVVYFKRLEPAAFGLLRGLQDGRRLSQAIEGAIVFSNIKVDRLSAQLQHWFAEWALLGWFADEPKLRKS